LEGSKRERDDHISFEMDVIGYSSKIDVKEKETRRSIHASLTILK
jgi:hypothetical protein